MKSATSNHTYAVIIIGAGPAGLCLGHLLKEKGVGPFYILEKGKGAGDSWNSMPDWLRLISYWQDNFLRPQDENRFPSLYQVSAQEFTQYLNEISVGLEIRYQSQVIELHKGQNVFSVTTNHGVLKAKSVVLCVGYYSMPCMLEAKALSEAQIPIRHFADLKDLKFEASKNYLVVGKALSAGQVIEQIHQAQGRFDLSCRSGLKFGAGPQMQKFFLRYLETIEVLIRFFKPHKSSFVPMDRSVKKIIASAKAQIRPQILKVVGKTVYFVDGAQADYDGIVLATGFKYTGTKILRGLYKNEAAIEQELKSLVMGFEAAHFPRLYFLGVDNQVDFTSRFLRGIRRDARVLVQFLKVQ